MPLNRQSPTSARQPVEAKSTANDVPVVGGIPAGDPLRFVTQEVFDIASPPCIRAELIPVAQTAEQPLLTANAGSRQRALGQASIPGYDVDDTIDGIGPPERRPRAADDFDTVNILEQGILDVPERRRVDRVE